MPYTSIISTDDLNKHIDSPDWLIIDCRFDLLNDDKGPLQFEESHLPHAIYANLETDLSGPIIPGTTGRHPLPELTPFCQLLSSWGIDESVQVVVYDDLRGMIAARLWWMLRWLGHEKVAVLDGGWSKWIAESRPVSSDIEPPTPRKFTANVKPNLLANADDTLAASQSDSQRLLDARAADRYRGENEKFDVIAGHIPGAISAPCMNNLAKDGCFADQETLRQRYTALFDGVDAKDVIVYCGSGVTAAHDILAILHAGLGDCKLYPGSWSHWITDANRAIAVGESPEGDSNNLEKS